MYDFALFKQIASCRPLPRGFMLQRGGIARRRTSPCILTRALRLLQYKTDVTWNPTKREHKQLPRSNQLKQIHAMADTSSSPDAGRYGEQPRTVLMCSYCPATYAPRLRPYSCQPRSYTVRYVVLCHWPAVVYMCIVLFLAVADCCLQLSSSDLKVVTFVITITIRNRWFHSKLEP
jgi:hypothetical protein